MKNLTDFRKTVETGMDPRLDDYDANRARQVLSLQVILKDSTLPSGQEI